MGPLAPVPYEWLGALALGILWLNGLLTAAAAMQQRRALGERCARLIARKRAGTLRDGIVGATDPSGAIAVRCLEQMGRAMTVAGPDRIRFTDRRASTEVLGGRIVTETGEEIELEPRAGEGIELWLPAGTPGVRRDADFDAAWPRASSNKGYPAVLEQRVGRGERVWVHREGDSLFIATLDPIADCTRKRALLAAFAIATIGACAAASVVALWPPVFGTVSTLGGVLCVACFLGIPPIGTAVRDAARIPPERRVDGIWQRPGA